jgi:hypothetical protein
VTHHQEPLRAVTDKTNEIKDIIALENTRASTNTVGDADDITGFTPELENAPKRAFRESDTGKDVFKREELMLMKVDGCKFNILTDLAIHDCGGAGR